MYYYIIIIYIAFSARYKELSLSVPIDPLLVEEDPSGKLIKYYSPGCRTQTTVASTTYISSKHPIFLHHQLTSIIT